MLSEKFIVTVDGSVWTGKTTVSQALAKMLGYKHINSGSLFKAAGYYAFKEGIQVNNIPKILELINNLNMEFKLINGKLILFVNNQNISEECFQNDVVEFTSKIAEIPEVREKMLQIQRNICTGGGFVVEGRDAGTVIFPNAKWKFYLDASMEVKIRRGCKQTFEDKNLIYSKEEIKKTIEELDNRDKNRAIAPLRMADDSLLYDNSESPSAEQDAIVLWYYITHKDEIIKNVNILKREK